MPVAGGAQADGGHLHAVVEGQNGYLGLHMVITCLEGSAGREASIRPRAKPTSTLIDAIIRGAVVVERDGAVEHLARVDGAVDHVGQRPAVRALSQPRWAGVACLWWHGLG